MTTLFETYLKLAGYDINLASNELKRIQSLPLEEFRKWQDEKKWWIAKHHYDNNPFYRKKVGNYFPDKWEDLPIMEKSDYQDDLDTMLSKGYNKKNIYIANTSGSTGNPLFFAKNKKAHAMDWALIKNRYSWHGLKLSSKQARFFGTPMKTTTMYQEKIKDWIMNRVRFPVFDLSAATLNDNLDEFEKTRFDHIYGYTNSLVLFARFLIRNEIVLKDLCPTLTHCITTAEVLTKDDRVTLENAFGIQVINEYGASEVGLIAFEKPNNEWLLSEEILFYETINDMGLVSNENEGNIVVTNFNNKAMPFIRYNIGDIGVISKNLTKNGRNKKLEHLLGRENDMIILPDNRKLPGFAIVKPFDYYLAENLSNHTGDLKEFVFRQTNPNEFILDIIMDRDFTNNEIERIKHIIKSSLKSDVNIFINRVKKIKREKSGKLKQFYSEIT